MLSGINLILEQSSIFIDARGLRFPSVFFLIPLTKEAVFSIKQWISDEEVNLFGIRVNISKSIRLRIYDASCLG